MDIVKLLKQTLEMNASDLHLSSGMRPMVRIDGKLMPLCAEIISNEQIQNINLSIMSDLDKERYKTQFELDFGISITNCGRFRVNTFYQQRGASSVFRVMPAIKSMKELKLSSVFYKLTRLHKGLILITGPTGSGKSTLLAAIIDYINENSYNHIITIEDPIEFVYENKKSLVSQKEVHKHTGNFSDALRSSLREDPDIILIGELRDPETIKLAITAAQTGHLVLGTLHTTSAVNTINRITSVFDGSEQALITQLLADSIEAVVCQRLLPAAVGKGRIAIQEIMLASINIKALIRDSKVHQIASIIQTSTQQGMQTEDQALRKAVDLGHVKYELALEHASHKDTFGAPISAREKLAMKRESLNN